MFLVHGVSYLHLYLAHGAFVGPSPPGGAGGFELAQGARVGAMGPGGSREVSGRAVAPMPAMEPGPGGPSLLVDAQGAAVDPMGGARVPAPAVAHGAFVPPSAPGRAVAEVGGPASGTTGRPCGPEVVCTVDGGATA